MADSANIEGIWQIESAELGGEKMPELVAHKIDVELAAGAYTVRFDGEIADRGTYDLAPHPAGQAITLNGLVGTNAGRTIPAICQIVGGQLHVCYGLDGIVPAAFESKSGTAHFLARYRRKVTK